MKLKCWIGRCSRIVGEGHYNVFLKKRPDYVEGHWEGDLLAVDCTEIARIPARYFRMVGLTKHLPKGERGLVKGTIEVKFKKGSAK